MQPSRRSGLNISVPLANPRVPPRQASRPARFRVTPVTPRCAIPGAAQPGLPTAAEVLRALERHRPVGNYGHAACLATYAHVLRPGTINLADSVAVVS